MTGCLLCAGRGAEWGRGGCRGVSSSCRRGGEGHEEAGDRGDGRVGEITETRARVYLYEGSDRCSRGGMLERTERSSFECGVVDSKLGRARGLLPRWGRGEV